jgi:lipopolysaccharide biosynthesis glycosyltransferase
MTKKLIFQINVSNHIQTSKITAYTFMKDMYEISERNARRYAERCGADYYKLTDANDFNLTAGKHLDYQKLKAYDFVDYDRIIYFDSDYIIKDNAPNLFDLCGDKFSAVMDPGKSVIELSARLGIPRERYFNAGFMYLTKTVLDNTREFLPAYLEKEYEFQGQGILNRLFYDKGIDFNRLDSNEWNPVKKTFGTYADHYAGAKKNKWGQVKY